MMPYGVIRPQWVNFKVEAEPGTLEQKGVFLDKEIKLDV